MVKKFKYEDQFPRRDTEFPDPFALLGRLWFWFFVIVLLVVMCG
jgi:hypothetical protein